MPVCQTKKEPIFYSLKDLRDLGFRLSRATIYRKVRDGSFPKPVKLGGNTNAWLSSEILAHAKRIADARNTEAK